MWFRFNHPNNPLKPAIFSGLFAYGGWYAEQAYFYYPLTSYVLWFFAGMLGVKALYRYVFFVIPQRKNYRTAYTSTDKAGSAGWASKREIKKAGLFNKKGFLVGLYMNIAPVFVDIESSGVVISPSGGGKTISFVIPALCHNRVNMIVPDLKGTLACQMAKYRQRYFKHQSIKLNPAGLYEDRLGVSARYNPLQILIDNWQNPKHHRYLMSDTEAMAMQLYPDPAQLGENQFWRNGTRKLLKFSFLYLVTQEHHATLSEAFSMLSQRDVLQDALEAASTSTVLSGDLARLAHDILSKIKEGDERQIESFREGAVQALGDFAPSSDLAANTDSCDFRFFDMRKKGIDVYLIADPTRQASYQTWLGLVSWCALTELIRHPAGRKICMLCDEVTNFRINNLPSMLTLVREYKISLWLIVQELKEFGRVYGRDSINTLLSQTQAKIFMNCSDPDTCTLVSNMLGEKSIVSNNYNLGKSFFDPITTSAQEHGRRVLTPDEVRRFNKIILFYRKQHPVALDQIGYHEVKPWHRRVGINPLFGKRFKGKVRLKL